MAGKHMQKSGGMQTEVRAAPRAKRVYIEPDYEEDGRRNTDYETSRRSASKRWLAWAIPLVIVLAVCAVLLGSTASAASRVSKIDTIFPNVYINGVNVGGLSPVEAVQKLAASGADPYAGASVRVNFPGDHSLTVTAAEMGLSGDPIPAVEEAYAYGRSGNLWKDIKAFRAANRAPVEISWVEEVQLNDAALREKINALADEIKVDAEAGEPEIGEEGVTLVKSGGGLRFDVDSIIARVRQAFLSQDYTDIQVEPDESGEVTEADGAAILQAVYDSIFVEMKNASYDEETGGVTESVRGVSFDMEAALALWDGAQPGETIFIPFVFTEPEVVGSDLDDRLFADCLAEKTTSLSGSSSARINNVILSAQAMDGTVINPGETFDYNTCLGQRTAARGYQAAGAYSGGKHVTEIGGGICQGSSTLYYCALYANLNITVRDNHYFTVSYLPRGYDATVSWGGPDFRFVNSRNYPIKIRAWVSDGNLTVQLWGTSDGTRVEMTSDTWEDAEFYYAQTYRTVYGADGSVIRSGAEAYSRYHKFESGTNTPPPEDTPEPVTPTPAPTAEPTPDPVTPVPITPEPVTPEPAPEPVPEPVTSETVPETIPETVPETVPETIPETVPETIPETVPEPVPESIPEVLPENGE